MHLFSGKAKEVDAILGAQEREDVSVWQVGRVVVDSEPPKRVEEADVCPEPHLCMQSVSRSQLEERQRTGSTHDSFLNA